MKRIFISISLLLFLANFISLAQNNNELDSILRDLIKYNEVIRGNDIKNLSDAENSFITNYWPKILENNCNYDSLDRIWTKSSNKEYIDANKKLLKYLFIAIGECKKNKSPQNVKKAMDNTIQYYKGFKGVYGKLNEKHFYKYYKIDTSLLSDLNVLISGHKVNFENIYYLHNDSTLEKIVSFTMSLFKTPDIEGVAEIDLSFKKNIWKELLLKIMQCYEIAPEKVLDLNKYENWNISRNTAQFKTDREILYDVISFYYNFLKDKNELSKTNLCNAYKEYYSLESYYDKRLAIFYKDYYNIDSCFFENIFSVTKFMKPQVITQSPIYSRTTYLEKLHDIIQNFKVHYNNSSSNIDPNEKQYNENFYLPVLNLSLGRENGTADQYKERCKKFVLEKDWNSSSCKWMKPKFSIIPLLVSSILYLNDKSSPQSKNSFNECIEQFNSLNGNTGKIFAFHYKNVYGIDSLFFNDILKAINTDGKVDTKITSPYNQTTLLDLINRQLDTLQLFAKTLKETNSIIKKKYVNNVWSELLRISINRYDTTLAPHQYLENLKKIRIKITSKEYGQFKDSFPSISFLTEFILDLNEDKIESACNNLSKAVDAFKKDSLKYKQYGVNNLLLKKFCNICTLNNVCNELLNINEVQSSFKNTTANSSEMYRSKALEITKNDTALSTITTKDSLKIVKKPDSITYKEITKNVIKEKEFKFLVDSADMLSCEKSDSALIKARNCLIKALAIKPDDKTIINKLSQLDKQTAIQNYLKSNFIEYSNLDEKIKNDSANFFSDKIVKYLVHFPNATSFSFEEILNYYGLDFSQRDLVFGLLKIINKEFLNDYLKQINKGKAKNKKKIRDITQKEKVKCDYILIPNLSAMMLEKTDRNLGSIVIGNYIITDMVEKSRDKKTKITVRQWNYK